MEGRGVIEIITEHGTRIVCDLAEQFWLRDPGETGSRHAWLDHRWQNLAWPPDINVGAPVLIHWSEAEWWQTTRVVSTRVLSDGEVPPPGPIVIQEDADGIFARIEGIRVYPDAAPTRDGALRHLAEDLYQQLAGEGPHRRLARWLRETVGDPVTVEGIAAWAEREASAA